MLKEAVSILKDGGVIAYPTEAVFGLGCDPDNVVALKRLLALKNRSPAQGLILIASDFTLLKPYLCALTAEQLATVMASWPGPVTWVIPAQNHISSFLKGEHTTLAVRVTAHPIARELCAQFGKPLVSTSANRHGQPPCRSFTEVNNVFEKEIDYLVAGQVGERAVPTEIRDLVSGKVLRG